MFQVTFYETEGGNEVVQDFLRKLPRDDRKTIGEDLATLQYGYPMGMPLCKPLRSQIWELRSSLPSKREARLLYFFDSASQQIIVVHAFIKTTRTTPKSDIDLAEKRKKEF
jgi:phage-related protein